MKLSQTALGETETGKVVNLLSNDVNRFDFVSMFLNSMWTAPLLSIIVGILLYYEIGIAGIIGMVIVFIVVPIQSECNDIPFALAQPELILMDFFLFALHFQVIPENCHQSFA